MTNSAYTAAGVFAGLDTSRHFRAFTLAELAEVSWDRAVYAAVSFSEQVDYIGSVRRPGTWRAIVARLREHLDDADKNEVWFRFYIWPCPPTWTLEDVRRAEGVIGRYLNPARQQRLPKLWTALEEVPCAVPAALENRSAPTTGSEKTDRHPVRRAVRESHFVDLLRTQADSAWANTTVSTADVYSFIEASADPSMLGGAGDREPEWKNITRFAIQRLRDAGRVTSAGRGHYAFHPSPDSRTDT